MEKICWQITVVAFMQPLQYDLRSPAAKDHSTKQPWGSHLHCGNDPTVAKYNGIPSATHPQQHLQCHLHCGNDPTVTKHNGIPSATHPPAPLAIPFTLRERSYSCKSQWNSVDRTCTKNRWNPIYNAEPIRPWSEHDPPMIRPHTRPSRNRRGRTLYGKTKGFVYLLSLKNAFRARLPSELHRQFLHQHHLQCHLHCGNDPTVAKHNGIPSATHPPAPLAIPFTLRERSYSCKSQWNSVDSTCTKNRWNPIYNAEPIRPWSAHDPTTHETVSQPSHRRGRSSRFGDGLCMEKHRVSCICYLSKTHFMRDFLQNSIGNSSTSTTCNAILTLSLTNSFPDILKVTINSVPT